MNATGEGAGLRVITLRPRRSLLSSAGIPLVMLGLPLIAVGVFVADPGGAVSTAITLSLVFITILAIGLLQFRLAQASVSVYGIVERGWFGRVTTVPARDIAAVVRVRVYRTNSIESTPQLFVVNSAGERLMRMRGRFWETRTMDRVASTLGVSETVRDEPVTIAEIAESDPGLVSWHERRWFGRHEALAS